MAPGKTLTATLRNGASLEFVWIEPGTFMMGSPASEPGRGSDEGPRHPVTLTKGFYLGKDLITQRQWTAVMGTQPWSGRKYVQPHPDHPAVYISWNDLQELVAKLNADTGEALYRLPSEAEWEYACRAGTSTRWSFGDDEGRLRKYAWYEINAWNAGVQYAPAVGTKLPNPWGLFDMHGNVFEWIEDWYANYYPNTEQINPK
ncbi:MAG: formylglycine-generating enzyme family protein, partial [Candidatus Latescibacteria bacterium]|nr:formylglycine-generating enzyme family protein [Candidatus Latescibacterota bacterium]